MPKIPDTIKSKIDIDPSRVRSNFLLAGKKYGVLQDGYFFVSEAIFALMSDHESLMVIMRDLPILSVPDNAGMETIFEIAEEVLGEKPMELKTEVIYEFDIAASNDKKIPCRVVRVSGGQVDFLVYEVSVDSGHTEKKKVWIGVYDSICSTAMQDEFHRILAYEMIHNKVYGKSKNQSQPSI